MQFEELDPRYKAMAKELLPALAKSAGKVLQGTVKAEGDNPAPLGDDFAPSGDYPMVKITLSSTSEGTYEHIFLMDKVLAGLVSGWVAGSDAPEEVGKEQYEAVQEAINQMLSQVQAALDGKENAFSVTDVVVAEAASDEDLSLPEGGTMASYTFTRKGDKQTFSVTHIVQGELAEAEAEGDAEAAGEEATEDAGEAMEAAGEEATEDAGEATEAAGEEATKDAGEATEAAGEEATKDAGEATEAAGEEAAEDAGEATEATADEGGEAGTETSEDLELDSDISEEMAAELAGDLLGGDDGPGSGDFDDLLGGGEVVAASPADFDEFTETAGSGAGDSKIDMLLDVNLDITVELGRKSMLVEEILRLGKGSVIELDKLAGEPVDILVNGKKLAEGEVVVIEDHFGVRLTQLIDASARIRSLGR